MAGSKTSRGHQTHENAAIIEAAKRKKQVFAGEFLSRFLFHVCIKVLWLGIFQLAARVQQTDGVVIGTLMLSTILAATDVVSQGLLLEVWQPVDSSAQNFRCCSGASLTLVYILGCLPFATEPAACLQFVVLANFVFNIGYLVEVRSGVSERVLEGLVNDDGLVGEVERAVVRGFVAFLTSSLCTLMGIGAWVAVVIGLVGSFITQLLMGM